MHPGQINYQDFDNNPALKAASDAFGFMWDGQAALNELRQNYDPEHTPARHARVVKEQLESYSHNSATKLDIAKAGLKSEKERVSKELETAANLKSAPHQYNAIVGTFQTLNVSQRAEALDELIQAKDGVTLATLIEAPLFMTKLTPEQRDSIKLRLYDKTNPVRLKLSQQIVKALAKCEAASLANINGLMQLSDGLDRFNSRSRRAQAVVAKAYGLNR